MLWNVPWNVVECSLECSGIFGYETFCFGMFQAFSGNYGITVHFQATIEEEPSLRRTLRESKIIDAYP